MIRVLLLLTEFLEARIATEIIVLAKRATSQPSRCFSFPKVLSASTALMPFLYGSLFESEDFCCSPSHVRAIDAVWLYFSQK